MTLQQHLAAVAAAAGLCLSVSLAAQSPAEISYDANPDFLTLPAGTYLGEVAGAATNSKGHVFVYTRTGHAVATLGDERTFYHGGSRLFQFDQTGKFVKEIGQGVYAVNFAQMVRVDPQDNIWIVDAGSNMVVKFDAGRPFPDGARAQAGEHYRAAGPGVPASGGLPRAACRRRAPDAAAARAAVVVAAVPRPRRALDRTATTSTARPTSPGTRRATSTSPTATAATTAIAKFTKDGNFIKSWGRTGTGQSQFNGISGVGQSTRPGNIYVADAGNKRIQVFDGDGTFKSQITNVGTPQAMCISRGATPYLFTSNSNDPESMDNGEIYKLQLNGQVVGKFGRAGKMAKEFGMANSLDCRTENALIVGEIWNWRVQKVTLKK